MQPELREAKLGAVDQQAAHEKAAVGYIII